MTRISLVIVALVVGWGTLALRLWPDEPEPPAQAIQPALRLLSLDQAAAPTGTCPGAVVRELEQHPNWSVRIDELTIHTCGNSPQFRHASIAITADGASWHRDGRPRLDGHWFGEPMPESFELTAGERAAALDALDAPCAELDEMGETFELAIGAEADAIGRLPRSLAAQRLARVFAAVEARYVKARARAVSGLDLELARGHAAARHVPFYDDAQRISAFDCVRHLPHEPSATITGVLTLGGTRLPIAITDATVSREACVSALQL